MTLTYTAPATLPDCYTTPQDVVVAEADGYFRFFVITVTCGGTPGKVATPYITPPGSTVIDRGGDSLPIQSGTGTFDAGTCTAQASGRGTIAGFPNIRCDYTGVTLTAGGSITGNYTSTVSQMMWTSTDSYP